MSDETETPDDEIVDETGEVTEADAAADDTIDEQALTAAEHKAAEEPPVADVQSVE